MTRGGRERAVSVQIGAVLLLAILVTALSLYQVNAVPDENRGVESQHHQTVQGELVDLRNGIVNTPLAGSSGSHTVTMGTTYPSRTFLVNPPPAAGTLETVATEDEDYNVTIRNASFSDEGVRSLWDGEDPGFATGALEYRPNYNEYRNAPTVVYEHSVLYNDQDGGQAPLTGQAIVDGDRITIVTLDGTYSQSRTGSAAIDLKTVSASSNSVDITNEAGERLTIRLATRLTETQAEATWERLNASEENIVAVSTSSGDGFTYVDLELAAGTYELRMAKVGLGSGVDGVNESYLTVVDEPDEIHGNGSTEVTLEVRDRYNNPVPNVRVNATADGPGSLEAADGTTGSDGRVTFEYTVTDAPENDETGAVNASFVGDPDAADFDPDEPENATATVTVREDDGNDGTGDDEDESAYELGLDVDGCDGDEDPCQLTEDDSVAVTAYTMPPHEGAFVDFSSRNASVVRFGSNSFEATSDDGNATVNLTIVGEGETEIVASSTEDTARRNVSVVASNDSTGPTASFTYEPGSPVVGETVEFNASQSDGEITTYEWDLTGDGTYGDASGEVVTHEFETDGDHTVGLEVVDESGNVDTERKTITVSETDPEIEVTSNVREVGKSGKYEFELNNTGTHDVTIEAVGINATTHAGVIRVGHGDILTTDGTSVASSPIPIDSEEPSTATRVDLDETVTLTVADPTVFEFDRFQTDTTGGDGADMTGEEVTMTVYLSGGDTVTLDLVPNG